MPKQFEYMNKESEDNTADWFHEEGNSSSEEEDLQEEDKKLPPSPGSISLLMAKKFKAQYLYSRSANLRYCAHAAEDLSLFSKMKI